MAKELEYKLQLRSPEQIELILSSSEVRKLLCSPLRDIPMETTYYDNAAGDFARLHWTFRHRAEGEEKVVCLKTPSSQPRERNEFQTLAPQIDETSVLALIAQGAPESLLQVYRQSELKATCGARFLRRCAMLEFPDGSRAELAADRGEVFGPKGSLPILELELELYEGSPTETAAFALQLCRSYGLTEQPRSKFSRAKTLRE
ncbi:MAG: CYTH domain-containing protein [Oscillospiraceae bacterium]|nr:CYTH domain-containing protein [Oscillospiraceae bacterium]